MYFSSVISFCASIVSFWSVMFLSMFMILSLSCWVMSTSCFLLFDSSVRFINSWSFASISTAYDLILSLNFPISERLLAISSSYSMLILLNRVSSSLMLAALISYHLLLACDVPSVLGTPLFDLSVSFLAELFQVHDFSAEVVSLPCCRVSSIALLFKLESRAFT